MLLSSKVALLLQHCSRTLFAMNTTHGLENAGFMKAGKNFWSTTLEQVEAND